MFTILSKALRTEDLSSYIEVWFVGIQLPILVGKYILFTIKNEIFTSFQFCFWTILAWKFKCEGIKIPILPLFSYFQEYLNMPSFWPRKGINYHKKRQSVYAETNPGKNPDLENPDFETIAKQVDKWTFIGCFIFIIIFVIIYILATLPLTNFWSLKMETRLKRLSVRRCRNSFYEWTKLKSHFQKTTWF